MRPFVLVVLLSAGLVALTFWAYGPLWSNHFIDVDDETFIVKNPAIGGGLTASGLKWSWTNFESGNWIPLTWMSLQLDASLSNLLRGPGSNKVPLAPVVHAQNLLWHVATVLLLFAVLRRLTGALWRSLLVAALFTVHPLHVESVAWASERKDVLSTFFWVLGLLAYGRYVERPSLGRYLLVMAPFVLGLLAKPMLVTFPCVLLLLDWWPLRRWPAAGPLLPSPQEGKEETRVARTLPGLLLEKVPLFAIAAAACLIAVVAQGISVVPVERVSLPARLANAVVSYAWYLEKTFWPTGLGFYYCHPLDGWQWQPVLRAGLLLLTITVLAVLGARRWPWLLMGWLWFLGTLVPVIGLVQIALQARADRYAYVPHLGLFVALVWSAAALGSWLRLPKLVLAGGAGVCLVLLSAANRTQVAYWHDPGTLWEHTLAVTTDNHRAHFALARHLYLEARAKGDSHLLDRARPHAHRAVDLQPRDTEYANLLIKMLLEEENLEEARQALLQVVQGDQTTFLDWFEYGVVLRKIGRSEEAVQALRRALEIAPDNANALAELGEALWQLQRYEEAAQQWQAALQISNHRVALALNGLGLAELRRLQYQAALLRFQEASQTAPLARALSNEGLAQACLGQWLEASKAQRTALELEQLRLEGLPRARTSDLACYHRRLAWTLHVLGQKEEAAAQYAEASQLEPGWLQAHEKQAWQLATAADSALRDPVLAWELASEVCQASKEPSVQALEALAAALAELGHSREAGEAARQALARATPEQARAIQERLQRYQQRKKDPGDR